MALKSRKIKDSYFELVRDFLLRKIGDADEHRQATNLLADPLRRPHHLGHLGAEVGGVEHVVADVHGEGARVGVVQPALALEDHRANHRHAATLVRVRR